jgi:threonine dehydrogenase-like Zn-dependent dehydrogenase
MRGLLLDADGGLSVSADVPEPIRGPDDALIGLRLAGICQTDLEMLRGYAAFQGVLGHEFVGTLLEDAGPYQAGQRVVGEINIACGACDLCREGIPSQCRNRAVLGIRGYSGAFSERFKLPLNNLHPVPDSMPDDIAVFTEPLAAALQITCAAHIQPGHRVALIGAGRLGLLAAQVLRLTGCDLIAVARQARAINLLRQWQIPYVDVREPGWRERNSAVGQGLAHVVVDCTGHASGFALALDLVRPRGTIVLKSTYAGIPNVDLSRITVDEVQVVGSRCGPFPAAQRLLSMGLVDVTSLIDRVYPLSEGKAALDHAGQPGALKVLLTPE